MQFLTKTKYLQVYRKNDVSTVYYELMTKKYIEYVNHEKWRPSFMYYIAYQLLCSWVYIGYLLEVTNYD